MPQGDTSFPYLFILVLEILLIRIKLDKLIKVNIKKEGFKQEDGGDIKILLNNCFADDMTVETKESLIYVRDIFIEFNEISGL